MTAAVCLLESLKPIRQRTWLMALISLHCGLRFSEIARLRWADINLAERLVFIRDPKGGRDRFALMTEAVYDAFSSMPVTPPHSLLFPTQSGTPLREKDQVFDDVVAA